jgi:hypothetical protein
VAEDARQLLRVELFVARFEAQAREHRDVANLIASK